MTDRSGGLAARFAAVGEGTVAVAAAVLSSLGLLALVGTAVAGTRGAFADAGLAATGVGLATVLYSLGDTRYLAAKVAAGTGLVTCLLAVALAPFGASGVATAVPGGVWGLAYAIGVAMLVIGGVTMPATRSEPDAGAVPEATVNEPEAPGSSRPTARVTRTADDDWTWRLRTPDGDDVAAAPREYDDASAARRAARRLSTAVQGIEPHTVTDASRDDPGGNENVRRLSGGDARSGSGDDDGETDRRDVRERSDGVVGGTERAAFEVASDGGGYRWRLRYGDDTEIATAPGSYPHADAAKAALERVRSVAPDAGVLTYDPATFEVYPREDDWSWRLRRGDDGVVAEAAGGFGTREDAITAIGALKDGVGDPAVERAGEDWRWRLDEDPGAVGATVHGTTATAREAFEAVRSCLPEAGVLVVDPAGFAVSERVGGTWGWRLRGPAGDVLAESPGHANRDRAIEGLRTVQRVAPHAEVSLGDGETTRAIDKALSDAAEARSMAERLPDVDDEVDPPGEPPEETGPDGPATAFEVSGGDDGWRWILRHDGDRIAGESGFRSREAATADAEWIAGELDAATVVRVDPTVVEVHPDEEWSWRLVDATRGVVARSPHQFGRPAHAVRAAEAAVEAAGSDPEIHREDGWRWRLRGEDGLLAVGASGFETTAAARDDYDRVSGSLPGASIEECETALELHPDDDGQYHWRLRGASGRVVAVGDGTFATAGTARDYVEAVREAVDPEDPVEVVDEPAED